MYYKQQQLKITEEKNIHTLNLILTSPVRNSLIYHLVSMERSDSSIWSWLMIKSPHKARLIALLQSFS